MRSGVRALVNWIELVMQSQKMMVDGSELRVDPPNHDPLGLTSYQSLGFFDEMFDNSGAPRLASKFLTNKLAGLSYSVVKRRLITNC